MHTFKRWSVAAAAALVAGSAWAVMEAPEQDPMEKEIIEERIAPVGSVTAVDKEEAAEESGPMAASEVYSQVCAACHDNGAAGAPIMGEKGQWQPRADKGMDTLMDHALNGFNAMPAKGGNPSLSEEEVQAAIEYMLEETGISL
ncbi:Cytochrome c5 [Thiohalospira halophila DSM 15071]|uniref:Cytochrome c5 n=1 Tax=Thiohalospira halophila DSM 15071 TaxID=1123397 RepID=A0A1I1Q0E0_9GAMM|nr:c-type cytochrome [Thiohalospira halophila]SFD15616.1 Cytochrome c5 [Thiohalospira halophila DSM 15071]